MVKGTMSWVVSHVPSVRTGPGATGAADTIRGSGSGRSAVTTALATGSSSTGGITRARPAHAVTTMATGIVATRRNEGVTIRGIGIHRSPFHSDGDACAAQLSCVLTCAENSPLPFSEKRCSASDVLFDDALLDQVLQVHLEGLHAIRMHTLLHELPQWRRPLGPLDRFAHRARSDKHFGGEAEA